MIFLYFRTVKTLPMTRPHPYRPPLPPPPAVLIRVDTCDMRIYAFLETRTAIAHHLRGRRWLHTPTTAHCSLFTAHWTYTFSAKEKDSETGLSYFGSRYYSSDLSIWLSVDPMSDKYPSLSPYVYCANNPVKVVDPNGEEIDIDGYRYIPGQSCPNGVSEKTQNKWNTLNKIYSTKIGETLISEMASTDDYCISISSEKHISADGSGAYQSERKHKSGTLYTNGNDWSVGTIAHELFHGYQDMKGSTGNSVFGEIEARLFATFVCEENIEFAMGMPQFSAPDASQSFYQSLNSLKQSFSLDKMKDFIPHFLSNIEGYGSLDPIAPNQKVLIDKFYPK